MWQLSWRQRIWSEINQPWDIIVVGGGITGAGILREATRLGLRTLLVEKKDFAWGTSSRSSKLVHGGLRYLKEGRVGLTLASVQERENLLEEGAGLIDPLGFLLAAYEGDGGGRLLYGAGLSIYDLLALQWSHQYYSAQDFRMLVPHLSPAGLKGGFRYGDAQTDDARLVMRVITEATAEGGVAINYVTAQQLIRDEAGRVVGVRLLDNEIGSSTEVRAAVVINAAGAWADDLRIQLDKRPRIRPLRGSHLVFPEWRFPAAQAVSFLHPFDQRPVFILPWERVTLVGTTDVDHTSAIDDEPRISPDEVAYLMAAVEAQFPSLSLSLDDIVATFAGIRPVIGTGKSDPSDESRDHVIWEEDGLLTVTGGKLTTFRRIALDVLKRVQHSLPSPVEIDEDMPVLNPVEISLLDVKQLDKPARQRLVGRYGTCAPALVEASMPGELAPISGTPFLWAELRWAARAEGVVHLDDLLLRRVRLGLLMGRQVDAILPRIRVICQPELGWDDSRWQAEEASYLALWQRVYSVPEHHLVPDWRLLLAQQQRSRRLADTRSQQLSRRRSAAVGIMLTFASWLAVRFFRLRRR